MGIDWGPFPIKFCFLGPRLIIDFNARKFYSWGKLGVFFWFSFFLFLSLFFFSPRFFLFPWVYPFNKPLVHMAGTSLTAVHQR